MSTLQNDQTRITVLPDLGGRIVFWSRNGGENLLDGDPADWGDLPHGWPDPDPDFTGKPGRGHIVWPGPQATWWTDQDTRPDRKESASIWPPDPVLTAAPYGISEHSESRIVLESGPSPYTGLIFRKSITVTPRNQVRVLVRATNTRNQPVQRNLWFNFRAPANGREYVPVSDPALVRLDGVGLSHWNGRFHSLECTRHRVKAFLPASHGFIACEAPGGFIILRFACTAPDEVPPGQGAVEIFRSTEPGVPDLLELEQHGPLTTIPPGAHIEREETWEFAPFDGDPDKRVAFLESLLE